MIALSNLIALNSEALLSTCKRVALQHAVLTWTLTAHCWWPKCCYSIFSLLLPFINLQRSSVSFHTHMYSISTNDMHDDFSCPHLLW